MATPYYDCDGITIYHGNCREVLPAVDADSMLTDPPYGIKYKSNFAGVLARSIRGDEDSGLRDFALDLWGDRPALVFGSWRIQRPSGTRAVLIYDKGGWGGDGRSFHSVETLT
jgi:site-specific DNA-methyltransferase (adenine-specific)